MFRKTFKYRLYPSKAQIRQLNKTVEGCRQWYNTCLEERKTVYNMEYLNLSRFDQIKEVKKYREENVLAGKLHTHILQVVVEDVDKTFSAFLRRIDLDEEPGEPRFKGKGRFNSFGLKEYGNGFKLDGRRLYVSGIGRIRVRWHREIEGTIKTLRVVLHAGKWYACFACEVETKLLHKTGKEVGIDVGIYHLLATSDGEIIENPKWYRAEQKKLRVLQRRVSRRKLGGKNRYKARVFVQKQQEQVSARRKDFLNKTADYFIKSYDKIVLEDLQIDNMVKNHNLSKSILDAGWGYFTQRLLDKAAEAGREIVFVEPARTSKTCSSCGATFEHLTLKDRWVKCNCGLSIDRDINAAINILKRGRATAVGAKAKSNRLRLLQEAPLVS